LLLQTGGLTRGRPESGLLHGRLAPPRPLAVTRRAFGGVTPFCGVADFPRTCARDDERWA
jgi:hypothetical protein